MDTMSCATMLAELKREQERWEVALQDSQPAIVCQGNDGPLSGATVFTQPAAEGDSSLVILPAMEVLPL